MNNIICPHVKFEKLEDKNVHDYEIWSCTFGSTYIGMIGWSINNEQYMFFPYSKEQLGFTADILLDIYEKVADLMLKRKLN